MWLREPVLILTLSVVVLGLLFAIRRILADRPTVSASDGAAADAGASRGNAGVIAPPPLIFLAFLALAAVLKLLAPNPTAILFPNVRYIAGAVLFIIGLFVGIAGVRGLRAAATNISTGLPATALVVDGIYGWSRNPLYLAMTLAYGAKSCSCCRFGQSEEFNNGHHIAGHEGCRGARPATPDP